MKVIAYQPRFREDFIRLNTAWIEKYFSLEQEDRELFAHLDERLGQGAMIFFAVEDDTVLATGMVCPLGEGRWEICKLATDEKRQGHGAGSAVFSACMNYAEKHGAEKLVILSNTALKPALHLYSKFGFSEVPVELTHGFSRVDIQLEYDVEAGKVQQGRKEV